MFLNFKMWHLVSCHHISIAFLINMSDVLITTSQMRLLIYRIYTLTIKNVTLKINIKPYIKHYWH